MQNGAFDSVVPRSTLARAAASLLLGSSQSRQAKVVGSGKSKPDLSSFEKSYANLADSVRSQNKLLETTKNFPRPRAKIVTAIDDVLAQMVESFKRLNSTKMESPQEIVRDLPVDVQFELVKYQAAWKLFQKDEPVKKQSDRARPSPLASFGLAHMASQRRAAYYVETEAPSPASPANSDSEKSSPSVSPRSAEESDKFFPVARV